MSTTDPIHTVFNQYYSHLYPSSVHLSETVDSSVSLSVSPPTAATFTGDPPSHPSSSSSSVVATGSSSSLASLPYSIVPKDGYTQQHFLYQSLSPSSLSSSSTSLSYFLKRYENMAPSLLDLYTSLNQHVTSYGVLRSTFYIHTPKLIHPMETKDGEPSYVPLPSSSSSSSSVSALMVYEGLDEGKYQSLHEYIRTYGILDRDTTTTITSNLSPSSPASSSSGIPYSSSSLCRSIGKVVGNLSYVLRRYQPEVTRKTRLPVPKKNWNAFFPSSLSSSSLPSSSATTVAPYHPCLWDLRYFHEFFGSMCGRLPTSSSSESSVSPAVAACITQTYSDYLTTIVPLYESAESSISSSSSSPPLQASFIHADLNDCNVFVHRSIPSSLLQTHHFSVIDWDDACYSYLIHETVITLTYLLIAAVEQVRTDHNHAIDDDLLQHKELYQSIITLIVTKYLSTYTTITFLNSTELAILIPLIKVRLSTSILNSQASVETHPSRAAYILLHRRPAERLLTFLSGTDWTLALHQWQTLANTNAQTYRDRPVTSYVPYTKDKFSDPQRQYSKELIETLLQYGQRNGFGKVIDVPVSKKMEPNDKTTDSTPSSFTSSTVQTIQGKVGYIPLTDQWSSSATTTVRSNGDGNPSSHSTTNPLLPTPRDTQRWSSYPFVYDFSARSVALTDVVGTDPHHLSQFTVLMFEPLYSMLNDTTAFSRNLQRIGWGQYFEDRIIYQSEHFINTVDKALTRTLHLGVDLEAPEGTPIYCPYPGKIHSWARNTAELDYGPTVIIEHSVPSIRNPGESLTFYTLYGHLSLSTIYANIPLSHTTATLPTTFTCQPRFGIGQAIKEGDIVGYIGPSTVNGGWPPHVHFQLQTEFLFGQWEGDYPGVCAPAHAESYQYLTPDPNLILRCPYIAWDLPVAVTGTPPVTEEN